MKKFKLIISGILLAAGLTACAAGGSGETAAQDAAESTEISAESTESADSADADTEADASGDSELNGEFTVLYTNDVHGYINNKVKNDKGEEVPGLSYGKLKALKDELTAEGQNVILADVGDHVSGTVYAGLTEGEDMIELMNATGYDIATLGNHEFDFGQFRVFENMDKADFPYVSCNFYNAGDHSLVLPAFKVFDEGGIKVAFIGITTPDTIKSTAAATFEDEDGETIYEIAGGADGEELYAAVQKAIDEAKTQADVVIAIGHMGVIDPLVPYRSIDVIENTSGLDAFLDGHSHTVVEGDRIKDKDGREVLLSQTGCYFNNIGELNIKLTNGEVTAESKLIDTYDDTDAEVQAKVDAVVKKTEDALGETIAKESVPFYVNEPGTTDRLVRKQETNLGDFMADGVYYYFNDYLKLDCDIALYNGGGIRVDMPDGIHTYLDVKNVSPFGNVECLIKVSGQQLLDALEWGARSAPSENGSFPQAAGIKFCVNTGIESTVQYDETKVWSGSPTGEYRVHDVEVYNRKTGAYEPLELDKQYTLGGNNFTLVNGGDGYTMFEGCESVVDYVAEDYMAVSEYVKAFADGSINTANSPLAALPGYLINYENPYGAGRIVME